jgi:hypothetical protein
MHKKPPSPWCEEGFDYAKASFFTLVQTGRRILGTIKTLDDFIKNYSLIANIRLLRIISDTNKFTLLYISK